MEKAFVINLMNRPDRWEAVQTAWEGQLTLVRADAFQKNEMYPDAYHCVFLKHRELLTEARARGDKYILIMEDDAVPRRDFGKHWKRIQDYLHSHDDWDVFNGGLLWSQRCIDKLVRLEDTLLLGVWRGAMAHFLYLRVDTCLQKMADWEAEGKPMFDAWYSYKMRTLTSVPFLAHQSDGYSDAAGQPRTWETRFEQEELTMKMRFWREDAFEIDRTSLPWYVVPKCGKWNGKDYQDVDNEADQDSQVGQTREEV